MTTDTAMLQAEPRTVMGKAVKDLRRQGITPLHLYGAGQPSDAIQASTADLRRVLLRVGTSQPVFVHVGPDRQLAFVQDIQFHPVRREVLHVDLLRVDVEKTVQVEVPVFFVGEAPATRVLGGTLLQVLSTILVECLPLEVPQSLHADVSGLDDFEKAVRVADITIPGGVRVVTRSSRLSSTPRRPLPLPKMRMPLLERGRLPQAVRRPRRRGGGVTRSLGCTQGLQTTVSWG